VVFFLGDALDEQPEEIGADILVRSLHRVEVVVDRAEERVVPRWDSRK
jgi:hypothetical protein